jgi:hypothetical protein
VFIMNTIFAKTWFIWLDLLYRACTLLNYTLPWNTWTRKVGLSISHLLPWHKPWRANQSGRMPIGRSLREIIVAYLKTNHKDMRNANVDRMRRNLSQCHCLAALPPISSPSRSFRAVYIKPHDFK